jgi:hypothetical protein
MRIKKIVTDVEWESMPVWEWGSDVSIVKNQRSIHMLRALTSVWEWGMKGGARIDKNEPE